MATSAFTDVCKDVKLKLDAKVDPDKLGFVTKSFGPTDLYTSDPPGRLSHFRALASQVKVRDGHVDVKWVPPMPNAAGHYRLDIRVMIGPDITGKYPPEKPLQFWGVDNFSADTTVEQFFAIAARVWMEIQVHEAREHFTVAGERWMNPHTPDGQQNYRKSVGASIHGIGEMWPQVWQQQR